MLQDGAVGRLLEHARDTYAARHRALTSALAEHGLALPTRRDGFNVRIPVGDRETELVAALAARGRGVRGGSDFTVGERAAGALRVTSGPSAGAVPPSTAVIPGAARPSSR